MASVQQQENIGVDRGDREHSPLPGDLEWRALTAPEQPHRYLMGEATLVPDSVAKRYEALNLKYSMLTTSA
jgi:hypothetical protein